MTRARPRGSLAGYAVVRAALFGLSLLPRRAGHAVGRAAGRLFCRLSRRHRQAALRNIDRVFGATLDEAARLDLARASFEHAGWMCADAAYFGRLLRRPLEEVAVYEGVEHLRAAAAEGRGVLVFSGHYGHWELIALLQARLGIPMSMVVRPIDDRRLDDHITRLRGLSGNCVIRKTDAARGVLKALRAGRAVAILIDQNVRGEGGVFVDFFGLPASTTPSLATYALKCGAPIVPVFSWPLPDGRLAIRYGAPIRPVRRGAPAEDILALTRACTEILEAEIRRAPQYWFWMHDRWRTRPAAERPAAAAPADGGGSRADEGAGSPGASGRPRGTGDGAAAPGAASAPGPEGTRAPVLP